MARTSTLRDRVREIRRKYKRVTPFRFFYNDKRELKRAFHRIKVWFLIHDVDKGYSIFPIEFKRALAMSLNQWRTLFRDRIQVGERAYDPIFPIFVLKVLPAINVRHGSAWKFKTIIGWAGWNDLRSVKHTRTPSKRHTATKKRNANARNTRRRRH